MDNKLYNYRIVNIEKGHSITKCFDIKNANDICKGLNKMAGYKKYEICNMKYNLIK